MVLELKDPPSGVKIASSGGTATYTITNDDSEPTVTITGGATASEGTNATFTVKSSHAPKNALSVKVNITEDEDADTGKDHVAAADEGVRTVTVAAGSTSQSFTVPTTEDWVDEPDGVITATVQAGAGYVVGQANKSAQVNVQGRRHARVRVPARKAEAQGRGKRHLHRGAHLAAARRARRRHRHADAPRATSQWTPTPARPATRRRCASTPWAGTSGSPDRR